MKKVLLFIAGLLLFGVTDVVALEYIGNNDAVCTETETHKNWRLLDSKERATTPEPVRCEEDIALSKKFNIRAVRGDAPWEEERYDARDHNFVTPIKDQVMEYDQNTGEIIKDSALCWSFSTMAVVESSYLREGGTALDLSERHLGFSATRSIYDGSSPIVNPFGYRGHTTTSGVDSGGTYFMSGTYLAQARGPVLESKVPFSTTTPTVANTIQMKADYNVSDVIYHFGGVCGDEDDVIYMKYLITEYGAITSLMREEGFNDNLDNNYYDGDELYTHGITIVGWDDTYDKNLFDTPAPGNGAWIVKDTYPVLGNATIGDGYHYMSYYDVHSCLFNMTVDGVSNNVPDNAHYYDNLGTNNYVLIPTGDTIYLKQYYDRTATTAERIDRVNLYMSVGDEAEFYVSLEDDFSEAVQVGEITSSVEGYLTADLDEFVIPTNGFYFYTKYISDSQYDTGLGTGSGPSANDPYMIGVYVDNSSNPDDFYSMATLPASVSFYSLNATQWIDTTTAQDVKFLPAIHVFTETVGYNLKALEPQASKPTITSLDEGAYFYIPLTLTNIPSLNDIEVEVLDSELNDVTDDFIISTYSAGFKFALRANAVAGTYQANFTYQDVTVGETITVASPAPAAVLVNNVTVSGKNEVSVRGTLNLTVTVSPSNAANNGVTWSSSDDSVATVDQNGVVTGHKKGTVTITATAKDGSGVKGTFTVNVIDINIEEGTGVTPDKPKDVTSTTDSSNPKTGIVDYLPLFGGVILVLGVTYFAVNRKKYFYKFN